MNLFEPVGVVIEEVKKGNFVILLDDENRENEGDLVILADFITAAAINFMLQHARGLIYLAIDASIAKRLRLELQQKRHVEHNDCAFTVSIDARYDIGSGISATDRAKTIHLAIDSSTTADDIKTPGHVFPIIAHDGGLLARQGHTEAAIGLAKIAKYTPAAVGCEILNNEGASASRKELMSFAKRHNIKIGTVASLVGYIRSSVKLGTYINSTL
ncbi:3,4-dihydroxy-2-butanone 4-phosphate synthase [Alphaproteobacteria bacterium]